MPQNLPLITEQEIETKAALMFPDNEELRNSFVEGVWKTVWTMPIETND